MLIVVLIMYDIQPEDPTTCILLTQTTSSISLLHGTVIKDMVWVVSSKASYVNRTPPENIAVIFQ